MDEQRQRDQSTGAARAEQDCQASSCRYRDAAGRIARDELRLESMLTGGQSTVAKPAWSPALVKAMGEASGFGAGIARRA